jgi:amino acid adenylation domain-containing protein/non-ribosomal peptide synthase protein (TIGR01720 family)
MDTTSATPRPALSDAKRALLEARLKGVAKPANNRLAITRRGGGPVQPMSWAQERLWFLDQMEPGSSFYNIPVASLVSAKLDVPTLERALEEIVRRHEAVRTVFRLIDGKPMQVVLPPHPMPIEVEDLRGPGGADAPEALIRRRTSEEGARAFDLANGPLFRAKLFRVSDADYALVLTMHHIVTDGWSMPIVTREMEELYEAFIEGKPSPLKDMEIQYTDYAAWQREYLTGATWQRQVDYWKGHLGGAPDLELPLDRPRPGVQTFNGGIYRFVYPQAIADGLRVIGTKEGASINMAMMAAFYVLLHKYSGQDDLVVGTLVGNRNHAEIESMVGYFVNSAAVRVRLDDDPTYREVLRRTRKAVLDADANQDLPFERLVDELAPTRDLSRNPVFQVMYFHHTFVRTHHHIENSAMKSRLNIRSLFAETGVSLVDTDKSKFDMTLATLEMDGGMPSMVEYNADLWDRATIARMMDHLRVLLERFIADPDARVSDVTLVDDAERARLLAAWNDTDRPYELVTPVSRLFEAHAANRPGATAVRAGGADVSYGEVNARANRLARRLRALGVGPGTHVGVCTARSPELIVSLLAVLKAGAAYVPADPAYPKDRIAFMLEDAACPVLLATHGVAGALPDFGGTTLWVDDDAAYAGEDASDLPETPAPHDLAYVLYTSGSTGVPKGVQVEHRSLLNLVHWAAEVYAVTPADRVTQVAGIGFDASGIEYWPCLAYGAALVVVDDDTRADPSRIVEFVAAERVTVCFLPTPLAEAALTLPWPGDIPLRALLVGGDRLRSHPRPGLPFQVYNNYGPTECTIVSSLAVVEPRESSPTAPTIGRPVANTQVYVLDANLRPTGTGIPGELCIGGDGLARGYLNRPELDAERFVHVSVDGGPPRRLYRTGDRGRWLPNGELEYLERLDQQVKIRGHRIELGEIEAALAKHPAVRDSVVDARADDRGDRKLVAYLVPAGGELPPATELRAFLKQTLPEYMVPAFFVSLPRLPLTPNGKVDRRALPAPVPEGGEGGDRFAGPRNEREETLTRIWSEVLNVPKVGIRDNFFELGGDSILSIQVIAKAAQEGLRITPKQIFQYQTVEELAPVAGTAAVVEAEQGPVTGEVPLTPVQRWFFAQEQADAHHFNLGGMLEAAEPLDAAALARAWAAVHAHHDTLRLRYARTADGGWTQTGAGVDTPVPFEVADLAALAPDAADEAERAAIARAQTSLDLAEGPLYRAVLFDRGPAAPARLLVVAHHLAVDAVSLGIVVQDLEQAYRQAAAGETPALRPKTTSFQRWAQKLVEHASSETARGEIPYWTDADRGVAHPIPTDHADGRNREGDAARVTVQLDAEATRALLTDVPGVYGTQANDVLLAALEMAFRGWTGDPSLLVDLEGHGREDLFETVDLSRTVGWFTSIYPVLLRAGDDADVGGTIKGVKEQLRAIPRRGVGYGILRWLGDDATRTALAEMPQPQVVFNYLGQADVAEPAAGSVFAGAPTDLGAARAPGAERTHLLAVDAVVSGGALVASFTYGTQVHERATVEALAEGFLAALRRIVDHCKDPTAGGFTPSDFPEAGLDQASLDAVLAQFGA